MSLQFHEYGRFRPIVCHFYFFFFFFKFADVPADVYIQIYRPDPFATVAPCTDSTCNLIVGQGGPAAQKSYSSSNKNFIESTEGIIVLIVAIIAIVFIALVVVWFTQRKNKIQGRYSDETLLDNDQLSASSSRVSRAKNKKCNNL